MANSNDQNSIDTLERDDDGSLPSYVWPGGYPMYYYASEGTGTYMTVCPECANQQDAEPPVVAYDVNYEDPDLYCDGCGKRIESAYAEPEQKGSRDDKVDEGATD